MVLDFFRRDIILRPSDQVNEYKIQKILGEGRYGICYQVYHGPELYILKQLKRGMLKKSREKVFFEEEILRTLEHKRIPRFIEKVELEGFRGYVLEFKEGRTFEDTIFLDKYVFSREEIYNVGRQLIDILKYLHSKGVVHRDIRVPNTLYYEQKINLVDFGLARWINNEKYRADMDFAFLGDFLLHLYYSSFEYKGQKKRPWYDELELAEKERFFLKRLMGVEQRYKSICEVEFDFFNVFEALN